MSGDVTIRRARRGAAPRKRRAAGCLAGVLIVLVIGMIAAGVAAWSILYRAEVDVAAGTPVTVTIPKGAGTAQIAEQLASKGIVRNANMFRLVAKREGMDADLRSGEYELSTGMPYDLALKALSKGPTVVYYDVTIPAGFTVEQVAGRFSKQAGTDEDALYALVSSGAAGFAAEHPLVAASPTGSLQGFLFPDTYRVKEGTKPEVIVDMMLDRFDEQVAGVDLSYAEEHGFDLYDVLTIAAIIDREAKIAEEYPKVSAVIYNRIKKGMRLQMCSTVMYGLTEKPERLTNEHLENEHPYNTYRNDGLPPGPMGSPGLRAIQAAARPADEKYLYFVLTSKDGSQTFASTYDEFLEAKKVYKKVFGD